MAGHSHNVSATRYGIACACLIFGLSAISLGPAHAETRAIASVGAWQVLTQTRPGAPDLCLARAVHPAIAEREVLWAIDPTRSDRYPDGFLRVGRADADGVETTLTVDIDTRERATLTAGLDGSFYSAPEASAELRDALAAGLTLTLTPEPGDGAAIQVSLTGSRAALSRAAAACE